MTTLHDKLLQEVNAVIWAVGAGMPYWQTESPDEVGVPLMGLIRDYKARVCFRSITAALEDRPQLSREMRATIAGHTIGEYLLQLCPVLLPEDQKAVVGLLHRMLSKATDTATPKAIVDVELPALSEN